MPAPILDQNPGAPRAAGPEASAALVSLGRSLPSTTATWVACARGTMSLELSAVVNDPIAEALVPPPYNHLLRWARTATGFRRRALLAVARAASLGSSGHLALRTRLLDDAVAEEVSRGIRQVVLLGAGLDSRAWRLDALRGCTVFEVDHPGVQAYKRGRVATLARVAADVRWVGVDFERDDLATALTAAGHDAHAPTFFIWEGVAMYLTHAAIDATLALLSRLGAPGSRLAMSYWEPPDASLGARLLMLLVRSGKEPIRTLLPRSETAALLSRRGFEVVADGGTRDWAAKYMGRVVTGPPERVVLAHRPAHGAISM